MNSEIPQEQLATVIDFAAAKRAKEALSHAVIERSVSTDHHQPTANAQVVDLFSADDSRIADPFQVIDKMVPDVFRQEVFLLLGDVCDECGYLGATAAARLLASRLLNHQKITPETIRELLS